MKKATSKNSRAKKVVGLRENLGTPFDQPCELGYHCPKCKYKLASRGHYDEGLHWSEYEGFLWCEVCNKDYPSCLCMPDLNRATEIYLDCLERLKKC